MARILVVDDEHAYRFFFSEILSRQGHQVQAAADTRSALETGLEFAPDVLIVDWMLRGESNGLNVAQQLAELYPGLRTIVITGLPSSQLRVRAEAVGVSRIFEKPFDVAEILETIEEILGGEPPRIL